MAAMRGDQIKHQANDTTVTWMVDTGASHHMTGDASLLSNLQTLGTPMNFSTIDFSSAATAVGSVPCVTPSGKAFDIHGVHFVPNGKVNILSAKRLFRRGWTPIFSEHGGKIIGNGEVYEMREAEDLWTVEIRRQSSQSAQALLSKGQREKTLEESGIEYSAIWRSRAS